MIKPLHKSTGAILPVTMFILVIVTLLALSTIESSNVSLQIARNQQAQLETEMAVIRAAEQFLSTADNFTTVNASAAAAAAANPADAMDIDINGDGTGPVDIDSDGTFGDLAVFIEEVQCLSTSPATGYSVSATLIPEVTVWSYRACAIDTLTGARSLQHFGVRMQLLAGNCNTDSTFATPINNCQSL